MLAKRATLILLLCHTLVLPLLAQPDADTQSWFSLTSQRTYLPGEKPEISVNAHNVNQLEFRVYRVNNPVKFFSQMQELHNFGGQGPAMPRSRRTPGWRNFTPGSIASGLGFATSSAASSRPTRATRFAYGNWVGAKRNKDQRLTPTRKCRCSTSSRWCRYGSGRSRRMTSGRA